MYRARLKKEIKELLEFSIEKDSEEEFAYDCKVTTLGELELLWDKVSKSWDRVSEVEKSR